jgi:hypothetical protein
MSTEVWPPRSFHIAPGQEWRPPHVRWLRSLPTSERYRVQFAIGGEAGYYVRGTLGALFSYGATPADLGAMRLGGAARGPRPYIQLPDTLLEMQAAPPSTTQHSRGFGLWLEYEASLFAYNELLQGAWSGTNNVKFTYGQIEPLVHHVSAGVDVAFLPKMLPFLAEKEFHLYLTQAWRSADIKGTPWPNHYWGGLTFSWSY